MTNARYLAQKAMGSGAGRQAKAEAELGGVLARLLMVAESYPDLKANQNFLALQNELSSTENQISAVRLHILDGDDPLFFEDSGFHRRYPQAKISSINCLAMLDVSRSAVKRS